MDLRVWTDDGRLWEFDVRGDGLRFTGSRESLRDAWAAALEAAEHTS